MAPWVVRFGAGCVAARPSMGFTNDQWDGATHADRQRIVAQLTKRLPQGFAPRGIETFACGGTERAVALFEGAGVRFALVPGGEVMLGFDGADWQPSPEEEESWQLTAEEYGIDRTIAEHVGDVTRRTRRVRVAPLLVETVAREVGWEAAALEDPGVKQALPMLGSGPRLELHSGGTTLRLTRGADGLVIGERATPRTHAEHAAAIAAGGFRLPTSDEWEHACGAGRVSLFRWGDHAPCDRYPTDSGPDFDEHRRPNAFGLVIAANPYHFELVAEIGTTRGGDGGHAVCGGAGFFYGWLALATSYFEEDACRHDASEPMPSGYTFARRVLDLS